MDLVQYWKQLAQDSGLSAEESEKVSKVLSAEKASETFSKEFIPRPVFSSQLDRQRDDMKKLYEDNYKAWYDKDVAPELGKRDRELATERAKVAAFESTYGKLDGFQATPNPAVVQSPSGEYISKADFESMISKRDQELAVNTVRVIKDAVRASQDHMKRFNEPLDIDAWEKYAIENNLSPALAYEKFIEPRAKIIEKTALDARIVKERDEAVKDYVTTHKLPLDTKPREISPLSARMKQSADVKVPSNDKERIELFREAWNESAEASLST